MMFVDDMVLVHENKNVLEGILKRRREVLENNWLKINKVQTEFVELRFKIRYENGYYLSIKGQFINKVEKCKYLEAIVQENWGTHWRM